MEMPEWWETRRFGLLFEPSVAAVPGWAPIRADAADYRAHLGQPTSAGATIGSPMVEVLAHHRDRWGHVDDFDDFVDLLGFAEFDPDAWAQLAVDTGAGCAATVARHHDGWRWWAAPGTTRTIVERGPQVDVVAAFADACATRDLVFGTSYSTTDDVAGTGWGDITTTTSDLASDDADELSDLLDRHAPGFLLLDLGADDVTAAERADKLAANHPDVVIAAAVRPGDLSPVGTVAVRDRTTPDGIVDRPWQLRRGIGSGHGFNRADGDAHHLDAAGIVGLLTEVVAKGGHLLLAVGVTGDGRVVDEHARSLRQAGEWIRRHQHIIDRGQPWQTWGDDDVRYIVVDEVLHVVDVTGRGRFDALHRGAGRVTEVRTAGAAVSFSQGDDALRLDSRPVHHRHLARSESLRFPTVYEIAIADDVLPAALFEHASGPPIDVAPLVEGARPGAVIQLGDGVYRGAVLVPEGVTVRGLGGSRTRLELGDGERATLSRRSRLEHLAVRPAARRPFGTPSVLVEMAGRAATVLGCVIDGTVVIGGDDAAVRASHLVQLVADGADRVAIARSSARGAEGAGIAIRSGTGHTVESCEVIGHDHAVHLADTSSAVVRASELTARCSAVWLERTEACHVQANFVKRSGRGIDVDGGVGAVVDGNAVCDGDSGAVVQAGATSIVVTGNTWERCRIGVLTWDVGEVTVIANDGIDLADADLVTGP